jgi:hypothetical protein
MDIERHSLGVKNAAFVLREPDNPRCLLKQRQQRKFCCLAACVAHELLYHVPVFAVTEGMEP